MDEEGTGSEIKGKLGDDVDALFKLPLAEFTGARNDLAARLKRDARANDASLVKALAKPSISAWAVNQLFWNHRDAFDRLLAASERFRKAQTSKTAAGIADMRDSLDARSRALSHLTDLATHVLRDAGHSPTPDTIHRITGTLEAVSAYAALSAGPTAGRLTQDVDPPGFESLASLVSGAATTKRYDGLTKITPSQKSVSAATRPRQKASPTGDVQKGRQSEEVRRARIAAAKVTLKEARRSLNEARSRARRLQAALKKASAEEKKADAEVRQAERQLREAEERYRKASAASQDAAQRAELIAAETREAAQAVEDARRTINEASKDLDLTTRTESRS